MRVEQVVFPVLRAAAQRPMAMSALDRVLKPWNPFSPRRFSDPYPLYEQVRTRGPIMYQRSLRTWFVTGHAEAEEVLRSGHTSVDRSDLVRSISPYTKLEPATVDLFMSTLLMVDPPDHTRLRRLVNRAFTPRAVAGLETSIEKITADLLDEIETRDQLDAMTMFADRLPIFAISDMLGLPRDDWDRFKHISDEMVKFIDPVVGFDPADVDAAVEEFRQILDELIAHRQKQPTDDMLTLLLGAEEGGDRLSRSELTSMVALLMGAGHETTASFIGNALLALHRFPTERRRLVADPTIAPNAIEELVRYDSPVQGTDRVVTEEFSVGPARLRPGQMVVVLLGAANRDPRVHLAPDALILERSDPRPLSFGHGIHHCLGAALARLEARIALPRFLERFPDYEVDHAGVDWKPSVTIHGPRRLTLKNLRSRA